MAQSPAPSVPPAASLRVRIEAGFERWGAFVAARPWTVIAACLAAALALVPQARHLSIDTHPENFLLPEHPIRVAYGEFKSLFGSDNFIVVTLETDDVFDLDFLAWLREVHHAIEQRGPHIDEVRSLVNSRETLGDALKGLFGK